MQRTACQVRRSPAVRVVGNHHAAVRVLDAVPRDARFTGSVGRTYRRPRICAASLRSILLWKPPLTHLPDDDEGFIIMRVTRPLWLAWEAYVRSDQGDAHDDGRRHRLRLRGAEQQRRAWAEGRRRHCACSRLCGPRDARADGSGLEQAAAEERHGRRQCRAQRRRDAWRLD